MRSIVAKIVLTLVYTFGAVEFAAAQTFEIDKIAPIAAPFNPSLTNFDGCSVLDCGEVGNGYRGGEPASFVLLHRSSAQFPEAQQYQNSGFQGVNNCGNCVSSDGLYFAGLLSKYWQCPTGFDTAPTSKFRCVRSNPAGPAKNSECDETTGCGQVGDPINFLSGFVTERAVDFRAPYGHLEFVRYHHSASPYGLVSSSLGNDWAHSYVKTLKANSAEDGATAFLQRPSGNSYIFRKVAGSWYAENDVRLTLSELIDANVQVGWIVRELDDSEERYAVDGTLQSIRWPDGGLISLSYANGLLESVTDERGRKMQMSYANGRLVSVALPDGSVLGYEHSNGSGSHGLRLTRVTFKEPNSQVVSQVSAYVYAITNGTYYLAGAYDASNVRVSSWTYDIYGRGTSAVRGESTGIIDRVSVSYQPGTASVTNALGQVRTHGYTNSLGRNKLTSTSGYCVGCGGNGFANRTYDVNGYPDLTTWLNGAVTDDDYNPRGLIVKRSEAVGNTVQRTQWISWHASLKVPLSIETRNSAGSITRKIEADYNARGQLISRAQLDGASTRRTSFGYCEQTDVDAGVCPVVGYLLVIDGPHVGGADVTQIIYHQSDAASCAANPGTCAYRKGDIWKTISPGGHINEVLKYDGVGRILSMRDSSGVIMDREYHPRGWLASTKVRGTNAASEDDDVITRYEYWPAGLIKKITNADGVYTNFEYDSAHRLTAVSDSAGNRIEYTLDAAGNRIAENTKGSTGALKRTLSRVYNTLGQLVTQADAQANPTDFTYDAVGNAKTVTDALGHVTSNDYDPLNRLKRTLQDVGGIEAETKFEYDANHNLTKVTDPKGLDTTYTYNGFGDLVQLSSPDTGVTTFTYDSAGNRASQTDARGITTTYQYDALNRLTQVGYPTSSLNVSYTYDVTQPVCQAGETFSVGRLTLMVDGSGSTQYCHDRFGQLVRKVQTTNGVALTLQYAYTKGGQLEAMTYADGTVVDYVRNAQGQITEVGVAQPSQAREVLLTEATYHPFGPIAGWVYGNGRVMQRNMDLDYRPTSIQGGPGGLDLTYGYDAVGNLTSLASGSPPPLEYGYDALGRLTESRDGPTQAVIDQYTYDKTGNRTSYTDSLGTKTYAYPSTSHRLSSVAGENRTYDAVGNTVSIGTAREFDYNDAGRMNQVRNGGVVAMEYAYNGRGEQVYRHLGASETQTLYDEAGHWMGDYASSGVVSQQAIWMDDMPVGVLSGGALHYIEPDHLGTPREVVDPARNVSVWTWGLKGEAFASTPPDQDADGDATLFNFQLRFPGQRHDSVTGLHYNYYRDYDPATGRYISSDPLGLLAGASTFSYVSGSPLMWMDMYGLLQWTLLPVQWNTNTATGDLTRTFPGAPQSAFRANTLARTTMDWQIGVRCTCGASGYSLEEFEVTLVPIVLMRQRYDSFEIRRGTRRDEMDHVRDLNAWANGARAGTEQFESSYKSQMFSSEQECMDAARAAMQSHLSTSITPAVNASHSRWDAGSNPPHRLIVPGN